MRIIDSTEVLALLDQIVEEVGEDFVYPDTGRCHYVDIVEIFDADRTQDVLAPSCIVGRIIDKIDHALLNPLRFYSNDACVTSILSGGDVVDEAGTFGCWLKFDDDIVFTAEAVDLMSSMQEAQDNGVTYGTVRKAAHGGYNEIERQRQDALDAADGEGRVL